MDYYDDDVPGLAGGSAKVLGALTGLASGGLSLWWTIIAFIGGTMPVLGWHRPPSLGFGLFWLLIIEPIALTVLYWVSMVVSFLVYGLLRAFEKAVRSGA
jgi:hypothetical protein